MKSLVTVPRALIVGLAILLAAMVYSSNRADRIETERAAAFRAKMKRLSSAGSSPLDDIYQQVVRDTIVEYNIAKRQGDLIQICVQAGLVATAQLQAHDEVEYRAWKKIEETDCLRAGMSR